MFSVGDSFVVNAKDLSGAKALRGLSSPEWVSGNDFTNTRTPFNDNGLGHLGTGDSRTILLHSGNVLGHKFCINQRTDTIVNEHDCVGAFVGDHGAQSIVS